MMKKDQNRNTPTLRSQDLVNIKITGQNYGVELFKGSLLEKYPWHVLQKGDMEHVDSEVYRGSITRKIGNDNPHLRARTEAI
jgi:hypothetical protein